MTTELLKTASFLLVLSLLVIGSQVHFEVVHHEVNELSIARFSK